MLGDSGARALVTGADGRRAGPAAAPTSALEHVVVAGAGAPGTR